MLSAKILLSVHASLISSLVACTSETPELSVNSCCAAVLRATEVASVPKREKPNVCPGLIVTGRVVTPVARMLFPATDVISGKLAGAFIAETLSAILPAQPFVPVPFGIDVCHCLCWSSCENRLVGTFCVRFRNWSRVVGATNVLGGSEEDLVAFRAFTEWLFSTYARSLVERDRSAWKHSGKLLKRFRLLHLLIEEQIERGYWPRWF